MNVDSKVQPVAERTGAAGGVVTRNSGSDEAATRQSSSDEAAAGEGLGERYGKDTPRNGVRALLPPAPFAASVRLEGDKAIVKCRGELDIASISTLAECLVGIAFVVHDLVLDFAELEFVDACGLRTITSTVQQVRAYGGSVSIRSPNPYIKRLLDLVNFDQIVAIEPHAFS